MLDTGRNRFYGVSRGIDTTPSQALTLARQVVEWFDHADTAIVDRHGGLIIFNKQQASSPCNEGKVTGVHFRSASCGDTSDALELNATATILKLFGFTEDEEIMYIIAEGGDNAHYEFTRQRSTVTAG